MASAYTAYLSMIYAEWNRFLSYFRPILFTFCMIGSCLNIVVFSRRRFRTISCSIYFLAAAVIIIVQFVVTYSVGFYGRTNNINALGTISIVCKIYMYVQQATAMMQRWLMTVASFDRYVRSSGNETLRRFAKVRFACRVTFIIVLIWLIIPIYRFIYSDVKSNLCNIVDNNVIALIHGIYTAVAGVVIPLPILIPSFILIARNLRHTRRIRRRMITQQNVERTQRIFLDWKRDQQVLAILFVQVIVYIILITPLMIIQVYNAVTVSISNKSPDRLIIEQLLFSLVDILASIYSAAPFYLNAIASRMFRNEFMIIARHVLLCGWLTNFNRVESMAMVNIVNRPAPIARVTPTRMPESLRPNTNPLQHLGEIHRKQ